METTLVKRAQHGDHEAFETIAAGEIDRLYSAARLIVRDEPIAEDAVQDTLVRAWRGIPRLRRPERFASWLHRILVNACLDAVRRTRTGERSLETSGTAVVMEGFEAEADQRDEVHRALARLTHEQRAVLVLRYFLDLSVPEVADVMGVPLGTAKSRLHHALRAMRAAVDADGRAAVLGAQA